MLRSAVDRIVAILAGSQGTGVMLTPRLVLTSAHVLWGQEWIRAVHPQSEQPLPARTVWRDDDSDVALLLTGEELVDPERWELPRLRWGALRAPDPLPGCQVVGFPAVQRFGPTGHLEYDQLTGTVLPMAGRIRSTLVVEFDRAPVADPAPGESPLAGLSGAPVFAGAVLIGVVTQIPRGRGHRRVEAVPVEQVLRAAGFPHHVAGAEPGHIPPVVAENFEELRLLPMRDEDVLAFSRAWHAAARLECAGFRDTHRAATEDQNLRDLERGLEQELAQNPTLLHLSRSPLLAAVVCALHRRRRGFLPETRWSLYNASLTMLLGSRDTLRRVGAPEGIVLGVEEHQQLLQRIAAWLARGGYAEFSPAQALHQIELAMRGMPRVRKQGSPEAVLTHLLNRSGLLQERSESAVQFIHRTFQDYLAAKEIQESDGLGELLRNADKEEWQDITLLAVGHCNRGEIRRLIEGLIDRGDTAVDPRTRGDIHVLAARCALSAVVLEEEVRERIAHRIRSLLPPSDATAAAKLASLGSYVLDLAPGPEELDDTEAMAVVQLARDIGGAASLPLLRRFARHPSPAVRRLLINAWPRYPEEDYAREVLAHMSLENEMVTVVTTAMATALRHCGPTGLVALDLHAGSAELARILPHSGIRQLKVLGNSLLHDLSFVRKLSGLSSLSLSGCPRVRKLSALEGLPLDSLDLELFEIEKSELAHLRRLDRLTSLSLTGPLLDSNIPLPSGHPTVERLTVASQKTTVINDLSEWPALRELVVQDDCDALSVLLAASRAPALNSLDLAIDSLRLPVPFGLPEFDEPLLVTDKPVERKTLRGIRHLTLRRVRRCGSTEDLARAFPSLTELTIEHLDGTAPDLSALRRIAGLTIRVVSSGKRP
ncbi:hypothetical protein [Streptomyces albogriseolus]